MDNESAPPDSTEWGSSDPPPQPAYGRAYHGDRLFYRVVVIALALIAVGALVALIYLTVTGKDIPQSIVALGSTAVGALAGVLVTGRG